MTHPTLNLLEWLNDEPEESNMSEIKSTFARLDEDDSRSGHDRLVDAITQRRFDHPDESYENAMFAVMRVMPKATREYQDSNL